MARKLKGHMLNIALGLTDMSPGEVKDYREAMRKRGYEVPSMDTREFLSSVGDCLHDEIKEAFGMKVPCPVCLKMIDDLNRVTAADAAKEKEKVVNSIHDRSWGHANWKQKVQLAASKVVSVTTGGKVDPAKVVLGGCFDRAVAKGLKPRRGVQRKKSSSPQPAASRAAVASRRGRVGGMGRAFVAQGIPRFVSAARMQYDIKTLIGKIPSDVTAIAGVARSGLSAATMISMYTHLPMFTIRQNAHDVQQTGNGWRLGGMKHISPKSEKVLIIDDTVMTGNSLKAIEPLVKQEFGDYLFGAIYVNPLALKKPHIHAVDLPWPHLLEWNLFNSVLSPNMATDFDGILCQDCPHGSDDDGPRYLEFIRNAKPLYLSRKTNIPLIVTARIEKYRAETMKWLNRWGIGVNKLIMHPAKTLAERQRDNIVAFKARHFHQWATKHRPIPPPLAFIESEDWQAQGIHNQTGRMTICPATEKVYGK
jgi:adenine/guanine phosphoribosyltransferase-like PRPP-binding protein